MPTSTFLGNAKVLIGTSSAATTDITDQVSSVVLTQSVDALEKTAMGDTARKFTAGLGTSSCTITVYASYASNESYAVLQPLVGAAAVYVKVNPTSAVDSATNPGFEITSSFLAQLPVINSNIGELATFDIELQGGDFTIDTSS